MNEPIVPTHTNWCALLTDPERGECDCYDVDDEDDDEYERMRECECCGELKRGVKFIESPFMGDTWACRKCRGKE